MSLERRDGGRKRKEGEHSRWEEKTKSKDTRDESNCPMNHELICSEQHQRTVHGIINLYFQIPIDFIFIHLITLAFPSNPDTYLCHLLISINRNVGRERKFRNYCHIF